VERVMQKILIVDDDVNLLVTISTRLKKAGYITKIASDGLEALDALNEERCDLIILDILMPHLDGSSFLAILRTRDNIHDIPIIVLSAKSDNEIKEICKEMDVKIYLVKPYDPEQLLPAVESILKKST